MKKIILGLFLAISFSVSAGDLPPLNELIEDPNFQEFIETLEQEVRDMHENYLLYIESLEYEGRQIVSFDSAPKLTYLEVEAIRSDQYPLWESLNVHKFATEEDHGGQFHALTVEYGYSLHSTRVCEINGSNLELVYSRPIEGLKYVIGYINYWRNSSVNFEGGSLSCSARSLNFPNNHEFDQVYIQ